MEEKLYAIVHRWTSCRAEFVEQAQGGHEKRMACVNSGASKPTECHPRNAESVLHDQTMHAAIDRRALDNISAIQNKDKPDLLCQIISLYLDNAPKYLTELREAIRSGDALAVERVAHTLKSSSATLGATKLSSYFIDLESLGRSGSMENTSKLISKIESEYAAVETALMTEMEKRLNGQS